MTIAKSPEHEAAAAYLLGADFDVFLREFCFVKDVVGGRALRWEWWPVHEQMVRDLMNLLLVVLKARQVSWSWFLAAYCVWSCIYRDFFNVLVISKEEKAAKEFLEKCHFIWERLPEYLRLPLSTDNTERMVFTASGSQILVLASTEDAGRGYTASLVIADEAAFHPYGAANYASYNPTVDGGGQVIIVSTANGMGDFFQGMYQAGVDAIGGIVSRFYPWWVRPGRDADWLLQQEQRYRAAGEARKFKQEYPSTDVEAFLTSGSPRFDQAMVAYGLAGKRDPLPMARLPEQLQRLGGLQVWKLPVATEPYCMGTDSAQGLGDGDFDCTQVLNSRTLEHVASIHGRFEPEIFGGWSVELGLAYNKALWGVEHAPQGHGHTIIQLAKTLGYPRMFWQEREQTRRQLEGSQRAAEKVGWLTTVQTKGYMIDKLAEVIVTGQLTSYDAAYWGECQHYVWNGRGTEASKGGHDDRVMAMAIARQMALQPGAQLLSAAGGLPKTRAYEYQEMR